MIKTIVADSFKNFCEKFWLIIVRCIYIDQIYVEFIATYKKLQKVCTIILYYFRYLEFKIIV